MGSTVYDATQKEPDRAQTFSKQVAAVFGQWLLELTPIDAIKWADDWNKLTAPSWNTSAIIDAVAEHMAAAADDDGSEDIGTEDSAPSNDDEEEVVSDDDGDFVNDEEDAVSADDNVASEDDVSTDDDVVSGEDVSADDDSASEHKKTDFAALAEKPIGTATSNDVVYLDLDAVRSADKQVRARVFLHVFYAWMDKRVVNPDNWAEMVVPGVPGRTPFEKAYLALGAAKEFMSGAEGKALKVVMDTYIPKWLRGGVAPVETTLDVIARLGVALKLNSTEPYTAIRKAGVGQQAVYQSVRKRVVDASVNASTNLSTHWLWDLTWKPFYDDISKADKVAFDSRISEFRRERQRADAAAAKRPAP